MNILFTHCFQRIPKNHGNSELDVEYMQNFYLKNYPKITSDFRIADLAVEMDDVKILQELFGKQMPPERYNGLINLLYVFKNANSTMTEITIALVNAPRNCNINSKIHLISCVFM